MKPVFKVLFLSLFAFLYLHSAAFSGACLDGMKSALRALSDQSPVNSFYKTQLIQLQAVEPNGSLIHQLKSGKIDKIPYVISQTDEQKIWFLTEDFTPENNTFYFSSLYDGEKKLSEGGVLEKGYITLEGEELIYHQTHGIELSENELKSIYSQLDELTPTHAFKHTQDANTGFVKSKILSCQDAFDIKRSKKNFFKQLFGVEFTLLTASIVLTKPDYFIHSENWDLLAADYSGSALRKGINGVVSYFVTTNGMTYLKRIGVRQGNSLLNVGLQHFIYSGMTDVNANHVTLFNLGYSSLSIFKADLLDNILLKHIPNKVFNACLKNKKVPIYYSQTGIRILEDLGSKMIYFKLRSTVIDD